MKRKWIRGILIFLCQVVVITALLVGFSILKDGMYLMGVPDMDDVESVTVSGEEFSDPEHIELAVKLTGFLRYSLFEEPERDGSPLITITYHLHDGKDVTVDANYDTVWWHSEARAIKDKGAFVKLAEGIFS